MSIKPSLSFSSAAILALLVSVISLGQGQEQPEEVKKIDTKGLSVATFAGGCFWCIEADFEKVPGVVEAVSGFAGGFRRNPSYREVSAGGTGHLESVQVYYDPSLITYEGLLAAFWRMVDPTDSEGQFVDRGSPYASAVFYHDEKQRLAAEASLQALAGSGRHERPIVTEVRPLIRF